MTYGVPYQGSKSRIAKDIIAQLPTGNRFVDLFAGGCAITHVAILSQKYKQFLCNDLYPHGVNLFKNALSGEYRKPEYLRWVSREEFFAKKDTDDFVKLCYSFANNGMDYMYSQKLEPLKKGFHYAVVFDDWSFLEQYAKANNWREGLIDELKKSVEGG
jgi:site-specific DNA-adenine methylase